MQGNNLLLLAVGATVGPVCDTAVRLASSGIQATVVNARFTKPLDSELIMDLASRIKRVVSVEENTMNGGFGSSVLDLLQKSGLNGIQAKTIGLPDKFIEHGSQSILRSKYGLDSDGIGRQLLSLFPDLYSDAVLRAKR